MDLAYGHRSFTDGGCDSFHRTAADVARREQAGQAGFERPGQAAVDWQAAVRSCVDRVHTGEDEAVDRGESP